MEKIAYLGPCGTYSEEVAQRLYGDRKDAEFVAYQSIDRAIRAVEEEEVSLAVVPIENSLGGSINITLDILAHEVDLNIVREASLAIEHCLFLPKGDVHTIVSHDQALTQCRHYLDEHYPQVKRQAVKSTGCAVEMVAQNSSGGIGAIGSRRAGEVFGLAPAAIAINDTKSNRTRFVVLAKHGKMPNSGYTKTSIVCQIDGQRPGSLYDLLYEFKQHDVNLTRIESRPARTALGEYIFFFDLEGTPQEENVSSVLAAIQKRSNWFKNLGSYPSENFNKQ
ncbi:MAG: prephenate dehydratase [Selenomonadales bacterium]|nr:prephenate dehydratase [Selenomonadales bacterium]